MRSWEETSSFKNAAQVPGFSFCHFEFILAIDVEKNL